MLDIEGTCLNEEERVLLQEPCVGGLIFFARNFESLPQLLSLVESIRVLRPNILLAVDQEGGRVQRFKQGFTRLPSMQRFGDLYDRDAAEALRLSRECGWLMAAEVLACGIDFSFAPVLDADDQQCAVISDRAFSKDPNIVAELAEHFIAGMREAGMACTGKHFPGHGSVKGDSHLVLPIDERTLDEVLDSDGLAFSKLLPEGLDGMMPAHILFPKVDDAPVGFSKFWLRDVLRTQMGFDGVIFSDDLSMEGASGAGGYSERADQALKAGCDMVLACNNRKGAKEVLRFLQTQPQSPPNGRLIKMAARETHTWERLLGNERYESAKRELSGLIVASAQ